MAAAGKDLLAVDFSFTFPSNNAQESGKTTSMHLRAKQVLTFLRMNVIEWH